MALLITLDRACHSSAKVLHFDAYARNDPSAGIRYCAGDSAMVGRLRLRELRGRKSESSNEDSPMLFHE
jgi:hypothetical protein